MWFGRFGVISKFNLQTRLDEFLFLDTESQKTTKNKIIEF